MKKIANILLLMALLVFGACSDSDKDEPKPDPDLSEKPTNPSKETFENEICNNLWVLELDENRYETEDGVEFPSEIFRLMAGGPGMPYEWYFQSNKTINCTRAIPPYGYVIENTCYDPSTGVVGRIAEEKTYSICQILKVEDDFITVKSPIMYFEDPGEEGWKILEEFENLIVENKDQLVNKKIYQVSRFRKRPDLDLKEELKIFFWNQNIDDLGIF